MLNVHGKTKTKTLNAAIQYNKQHAHRTDLEFVLITPPPYRHTRPHFLAPQTSICLWCLACKTSGSSSRSFSTRTPLLHCTGDSLISNYSLQTLPSARIDISLDGINLREIIPTTVLPGTFLPYGLQHPPLFGLSRYLPRDSGDHSANVLNIFLAPSAVPLLPVMEPRLVNGVVTVDDASLTKRCTSLHSGPTATSTFSSVALFITDFFHIIIKRAHHRGTITKDRLISRTPVHSANCH